jgi:hypothetical protein
VSYDVSILASDGSVLVLPEEWATLLAEEVRRIPVYAKEAAVSAARKIELRLTGEETSPVEFDEDEQIEVLKTLDAVCIGWHKSEGGAWKDSAAHAFYSAFAGS